MSEPKHTPIATLRPWRITVGGGTIIGPDIAEGVYPQIVCGGADRGDQELIVRAVNAHEAMRAALAGVVERLTRAVQDGDTTRVMRALDVARAALALAEGD